MVDPRLVITLMKFLSPAVQSPAVRPFDTENLLRVETSPQLIPPLLGVSPASPLLLRRAETSPSCIEHYHDLENTQFHNQVRALNKYLELELLCFYQT